MASEFLKHTSTPSSLHPLLTGLVPRQRLQDCTSAEGVKGCSSIFPEIWQKFFLVQWRTSIAERTFLWKAQSIRWHLMGTNEVTGKMQLTCTIRLQPCGPVAYRKHGACRMWQLSATSSVLFETFAPWSISNSLPLDWVLFPPLLWKHCEKTTRNIQVSKRWRPDGLAAKVIIFANWRGFSGGTRLDTWMFFLGSGQWGGDTTMDGFFVFFPMCCFLEDISSRWNIQ